MAAHQVNITDRAKRYRAQNNVTGPRKCVLCGSRADLGVMHLTGNESHGEPANLAYGCRSCNAKLAAAFKKIGAGRPTNQYNPASGVPTFEQYAWAVSNGNRKHWERGAGWVKGEKDEFGAIIHATPKHKRIEYARRIAALASRTKHAAADDRWNPANPLFGPDRPRLFGKPYVAPKGGTGPSYVMPQRELKALEAKEAATNRREAARERKRADDLNAKYLKSLKTKATTFKGRAIKQIEGGSWVIPSIDKESEFDTVQDAKAFITSWKRNPARANPGMLGTLGREKVGRAILRKMDALQKRWKVANASGQSTADIERKIQHLDSELKQLMRVNPASASAEVFEEFHGYEPTEVITVSKKVHHHKHLASAGELVGLQVKPISGGPKRKIEGLGECFLAFNEAKSQLFIEGGDQRMSPAELKKFGIKTEHELHTLGKLVGIGYFTTKTHLGDEGGEAVYTHTFRATNVNGKHVIVKIARDPDLIYRVMDEQFEVSGGSYEILREGINK